MRPPLHKFAHECILLGDLAAAAMVDLRPTKPQPSPPQLAFILLALR